MDVDALFKVLCSLSRVNKGSTFRVSCGGVPSLRPHLRCLIVSEARTGAPVPEHIVPILKGTLLKNSGAAPKPSVKALSSYG